MSLSNYFTPVPNASVTFEGTTVSLDGQAVTSDQYVEDSDGNYSDVPVVTTQISDLTFQATAGEMVLVLGNPTSALFKGLFHGHKHLNYSPQGSIRFKDNEFKAYSSKAPHQIIYNNEQDVHFPFLTVKQTIDFALSCKFDIPVEERNKMRDEMLREFGLSHVGDTIVGNDYVRGVSGGERKRISIIETFIANGSVYLWDNSTKGLDSSTAVDFLEILRKMARATRSVNFVKISQASDKIVEKFDKILMLSESYQVFYGTVDECLIHFRENLGIAKDPNDCIIEYLTSILNFQFKTKHLDANGSSDHIDIKAKEHSEKTLSNIGASLCSDADLHKQWRKSSFYDDIKHQISEFNNNNRNDVNHINPEDITKTFSIPLTQQLKYCTIRAFQRSLGDKAYMISQLISVIIQSLVIGSLFYDLPMTTIGSFSRGSLTFFSILFFTFLSLADMPIAFQRQTVVRKQTLLHFYFNSVETLATTIFDYCFKFLLVVIFTIILYFLAHLQYKAPRFFIFLLFLSIYNFCMVSLFSLTTMFTPTISLANLLAGILLLAIAMYASYVIYLKDMHPWFVWIAYLNPAMYAMEAILSNEMFNLKLDCTDSVVPRGPAYTDVPVTNKACAWQGATLGNDYVRGKDYLKNGLSYTYKHVWRNFGILIGFLCFFIALNLFASEYIKPVFYNDGPEFIQNFVNRWFGRTSTKSKHVVERAHAKDDVVIKSASLSSSSSISSSETAKSNPFADRTVQAQKHVISWKNINYTVGGDKKLINNVSGYIGSGLTALMGESGAGKTTLLNVLSQRTESGVVTGEFLIDGKPLTNENAFRRSIGFVQQQDIHLDLLTVKESLEISSELRGDGDKEYVDSIADLLKLPLDILVRELNPTQKKLLSIGVELVTKPSLLLFLDEPTSGLDAEAALTIVQFLKKLSMQGQAIFCTIHQPSKSVISYFDNIYLLKRGGECVFFGPINEACGYFMSHDKRLTYDPEIDNPADFVIDVVGSNDNSENDADDKIELVSRGENPWSARWASSQERHNVDNEVVRLEQQAVASGVDFTTSVWEQPSYMKQLIMITKRQYICTRRDRSYIAAKYLLNGGAGLFIGFSFWKIKHTISGLQDSIFFCFMALCVSSPLINQVQDKALQSKEVFIARESRSNTYHWTCLLLAQFFIELPLAMSSSTLFFVCAFFCCGFDNSGRVAGVFYLNYILFSAYYLTLGLWLIYTAPNLQTAAVFVAFIYSFTASFCGVMQPYGLFPGFWKFMYRVSPYTYFVETFVSVLLHDRKVICNTSEMVPGQPTGGKTCGQFFAPYISEYGGWLKNPKTFTVCAYCTYDTGDDFLKQQNMSYDHIWRNYGIEWAFVAFNFFAMFAGYYLTYVKKVWPKVFKFIMKLVPTGLYSKMTKQ
ncbi:ATP-binding cassette sterol transporter AUS1 [Nakaseomyces bracarensis]|uniref:ATP-binding cassette sterol transporter AUS1 n=1 Tax=Nakaseomyces bracarensis TaxID=273131 RepID=UPI003871C2D0